MDDIFAPLLDAKLLVQLKSLALYGGCFLSIGMLHHLVLSSVCPNLGFLQVHGINWQEFQGLKTAVASKHLDIRICPQSFEMYWEFYCNCPGFHASLPNYYPLTPPISFEDELDELEDELDELEDELDELEDELEDVV